MPNSWPPLEKLVGKEALTSKFGLDCFALVDKLLRKLGAATAADGDVPVTATADYDWGDGILLDSIQPGDILQFNKHFIDIGTWKYANGKWYEASGRTLTRPHHTAIVMEVRKDGSVVVVEQNVASKSRQGHAQRHPETGRGRGDPRSQQRREDQAKGEGRSQCLPPDPQTA